MGAVTDDEVIRKRLLIDGDGAGDDRRINVLLKSFTKWCNSPGTPEEGFTQYQRMLGILAQCEFSMGKTLMVYDMNLREMENYEKIYADIGMKYGCFSHWPGIFTVLTPLKFFHKLITTLAHLYSQKKSYLDHISIFLYASSMVYSKHELLLANSVYLMLENVSICAAHSVTHCIHSSVIFPLSY
uniref:Uncharacterized protein n=1 Tax=Monopterus albus TaxID=43700 RepID=A0A3Q3Q4G6_MONAL|nr:THO complex subunit 7 homolog [Monopterus albus]